MAKALTDVGAAAAEEEAAEVAAEPLDKVMVQLGLKPHMKKQRMVSAVNLTMAEVPVVAVSLVGD